MSKRVRSWLGASKEAEDGFTLIELLVVLLIMGVLLGIAVPTYLSVTASANKTAAQSNLQTALTGAKVYFVSTPAQSYSAIAPSPSPSITGTSLTYNAAGTASTGPSVISIDGGQESGTALVLAALSTSGKCYAIVDMEAAPTSALANLSPSATPPTSAGTYYGEFTPSIGQPCSATGAETNVTYQSTTTSGWA